MADRKEYESTVFINCPFDDDYAPIFEAIVFTVVVCGFRPSCARERLDSSEIRLDKIIELIRSARYSIHDLSRVELDGRTKLPRFNMPLELGVDIGCKRFARGRQDKTALVFERNRYDYQKYVSDISGQDVANHDGNAATAIRHVRDWLRIESGRSRLPGAKRITTRYDAFRTQLPAVCSELGRDIDELTFADFVESIELWLETQAEG